MCALFISFFIALQGHKIVKTGKKQLHKNKSRKGHRNFFIFLVKQKLLVIKFKGYSFFQE